MAKTSGLAWTTLTVDDGSAVAQDLRTDITNFEFATPRGTWDVTGIDKSAFERLLLLADFTITLNGAFDPGANLAHAVLSTVSSDSDLRTVALEVSSQTLSNECIFTDYQLTRAEDGKLTWQAPAMLADGTVPTWA